jgi:uroporphyrinogen-III synthase
MHLRAMVATPDGRRSASAEAAARPTLPEALGEQVSSCCARRTPTPSWPSARPSRPRPDDLTAVVITRPRQQAEPLARAVAALGRTPVLLPLLEISPLPTRPSCGGCWPACPLCAGGLRLAERDRRRLRPHRRWPAGVDIAVVGEGSRAALAKHGASTPERVRIHCPPTRPQRFRTPAAGARPRPAGRPPRAGGARRGRARADARRLRAAGATVETVAGLPPQRCRPDAGTGGQLRRLAGRPNDWIITSSEALRGLASLVAGWNTAQPQLCKNATAAAPDRAACPHP